MPADKDPRQESQWFRNSGSEKSRGRGKGRGRAPGARGAPHVPRPIADVSQNNAGASRRRVRQRAVSISSSGSEDERAPAPVPVPVPVIEARDSPPVHVPAAAADVAFAAPAAPLVPVDVAHPLQGDEPPAAVEIEPRVKNAGHKEVIKTALPYLRSVMLSAESCTKPPRDQVRQCLFLVESNGKKFWGQWDHYTRKRTVEDLILQFYYDAVKALL